MQSRFRSQIGLYFCVSRKHYFLFIFSQTWNKLIFLINFILFTCTAPAHWLEHALLQCKLNCSVQVHTNPTCRIHREHWGCAPWWRKAPGSCKIKNTLYEMLYSESSKALGSMFDLCKRALMYWPRMLGLHTINVISRLRKGLRGYRALERFFIFRWLSASAQ